MKFHLIGIGGMGMAALARLLIKSGHTVTGSDAGIFPPMSDVIKDLGIEPKIGYSGENIPSDTDIVVVGNAITRENSEAVDAQKRDVKIMSMPEVLAEFFLKTRTSVVIAGTHGKTTTTLLLSWLLEDINENPSFFAGGIGLNWNLNAKFNKGPLFVLEGDEYDTAYFDKRPKFIHYRPKAVLLTSIEFDHADIYSDLETIKKSFRQLLSLIPPDGLLIANGDDENVLSVLSSAKCKIKLYGLRNNVDYKISDIKHTQEGTFFRLSNQEFLSKLMGKHNVFNASACLSFCYESGFEMSKVKSALIKFLGVVRRQEIIGEFNEVLVIDDFAHHPTAISETIAGVKERYADRRIWAVFEPRSNTCRRNFFTDELAKALSLADRAIIADIFRSEKIPENQRLDADLVAKKVFVLGGDCHHISKSKFIEEYLLRKIDKGDVVLFMSNGLFDNIPRRFFEALKRRRW